jgi:hypothetical protein
MFLNADERLIQYCMYVGAVNSDKAVDDETLPNFIKTKHPTEGGLTRNKRKGPLESTPAKQKLSTRWASHRSGKK